jgi:hypothetical protein
VQDRGDEYSDSVGFLVPINSLMLIETYLPERSR